MHEEDGTAQCNLQSSIEQWSLKVASSFTLINQSNSADKISFVGVYFAAAAAYWLALTNDL